MGEVKNMDTEAGSGIDPGSAIHWLDDLGQNTLQIYTSVSSLTRYT